MELYAGAAGIRLTRGTVRGAYICGWCACRDLERDEAWVLDAICDWTRCDWRPMLRWSIMWDAGELRLEGGGVMAVWGAGTR